MQARRYLKKSVGVLSGDRRSRLVQFVSSREHRTNRRAHGAHPVRSHHHQSESTRPNNAFVQMDMSAIARACAVCLCAGRSSRFGRRRETVARAPGATPSHRLAFDSDGGVTRLPSVVVHSFPAASPALSGSFLVQLPTAHGLAPSTTPAPRPRTELFAAGVVPSTPGQWLLHL